MYNGCIMREHPIITGKIYHVCNRAVDGKNIFANEKDIIYFLETVVRVNSINIRPPSWTLRLKNENQTPGVGEGRLVKIYALCIMPNHFHFLVEQLIDNGIAIFMQRLCNSFSKQFNNRYERKGALFMGRFKAIEMTSEEQVVHIFTYIHANPLDLVEPAWRNGEIKNWYKAKEFLSQYLWSSLGVYTGGKFHQCIAKIIDQDLAVLYFEKPKDHLEAIKEWGLSTIKLPVFDF